MSLYLVTYDLHQQPESVYAPLHKALEDAHALRAQKNAWFLNSPYSAQQNHDWFSKHTYQGDSLMVISVDTGSQKNWMTSNSIAYSAFVDGLDQHRLRAAFRQG